MNQNQQDQNHLNFEVAIRFQMVCDARHIICYGKRWIMWTVLAIKVITSLYSEIAAHKKQAELPPAPPASYSPVTPNPRRE